MERVGLTLDRRIPAKQFASGLANINYLLSVDGRPVVLRRPPSGDLPPGAHDMAREHRILSRLSAAFPLAPKSLHLCEDVDILGVPFQLLEYRNGIVIKGDDASLLEDHPGRARALGTTLVDTFSQPSTASTLTPLALAISAGPKASSRGPLRDGGTGPNG